MILVAQISSLISLILTIIGLQKKSKNEMIMVVGIANIFYALSIFLLGNISGGIMLSIATIRMFVFFILEKRGYRSYVSLYSFQFLTIIASAVGTFTALNIVSCIGLCVYTYGAWQPSRKVFLYSSIFLSCCLIVFNLFSRGYINVAMEVFVMYSAILSLKKAGTAPP